MDTALSNADWSPRDIKANDTHLYWNDSSTNAIYRANSNGTGAQLLISRNPASQGIEFWDNATRRNAACDFHVVISRAVKESRWLTIGANLHVTVDTRRYHVATIGD